MTTIEGIRARVYFLRTEEGGRGTPAATGYRPQFKLWPDRDELNDGVIFLDDREWISPGDESIVRVAFLSPEYVPDSIAPGTPFQIQEGPRVVGRGVVLDVITMPSFWQQQTAPGQRAEARS